MYVCIILPCHGDMGSVHFAGDLFMYMYMMCNLSCRKGNFPAKYVILKNLTVIVL